jgi:ergothioneine biosynthesis protein EgtB
MTTHAPARSVTTARESLAQRVAMVRARSLALVSGFSPEDLVVQSMPDASPAKWSLGHTTWFFETIVLAPRLGLAPLRPEWHYLFNSYYEALGARHPRPQRGLLTRPPLDEVLAWRRAVDERLIAAVASEALDAETLALIELGLQHEQQHQELLVTDLKHLFSCNPLRPAPWPAPARANVDTPLRWLAHEHEGPQRIGATTGGFAFDNERPAHTVWLRPFALASRPVSVGEYLRFIDDGGYRDPAHWLSDGWQSVQTHGWDAPLYWHRDDDHAWHLFTAAGMRPLDHDEPVAHLSFYEADAYARWFGARLPLEAEWETIATLRGWSCSIGADAVFHPVASAHDDGAGQVWEWTASAYLPYPGFAPLPGAVGEYNGKFMSGQMVLRGGSCATPAQHSRRTYRNFFPPSARWQFTGLRLAKDLR